MVENLPKNRRKSPKQGIRASGFSGTVPLIAQVQELQELRATAMVAKPLLRPAPRARPRVRVVLKSIFSFRTSRPYPLLFADRKRAYRLNPRARELCASAAVPSPQLPRSRRSPARLSAIGVEPGIAITRPRRSVAMSQRSQKRSSVVHSA